MKINQKKLKTIEFTSKSIIDILAKISNDTWKKIIKMDPVWMHLEEFHTRFTNGKYCVLLMMLALNAYQLKGKAEINYWSFLQKHLKKYDTPINLNELEGILIDFYKYERLPKGKIKRISTFLNSKLANRLWTSDIESIAEKFQDIWYELAGTMKQKPTAKTIVFSMKCLGFSLLIHQQNAFDYNTIPIPVDSRIEKLTKKVLHKTSLPQNEIQQYWGNMLTYLQQTQPSISMIHLDSILWQIEPLNTNELISYFNRININILDYIE